MWEIEGTDEFAAWFRSLDNSEAEAVAEAVDALAGNGPALGRPYVDTLARSRHPNMKELRPRCGHLRVLFAFDPRRTAILLLGGDKSGRWAAWYREAIPKADDLYDAHLETLKQEGLI